MNLNRANFAATHVTVNFNVGMYTCASGAGFRLPPRVHGVRLSRLFHRYSVVDLRYPLASSAHRVIGTRQLQLVGPATVLVGAKHNPLVGRRSLTSTLGGNAVCTTNMSMLSRRPPHTSGPLLSTHGYCVAPRVT